MLQGKGTRSVCDYAQHVTTVYYRLGLQLTISALSSISHSQSMQAGIRGLITTLNSAGRYMPKVRRVHSTISTFHGVLSSLISQPSHPRLRWIISSSAEVCPRAYLFHIHDPPMLNSSRWNGEALSGLRSHAHFYSVSQTARRYS